MEMLLKWATSYSWFVPVVFVFGSLGLGFFVQKVVFHLLHKMAKRSSWEADDVIVSAFQRAMVLWFLLAGIHFALPWIHLARRAHRFAENFLLVIFLLTLTMVLARITGSLVTIYSAKSEGLLPSTSIFRNLARLAVFVLGILVILQTLGIAITPMLTALGVGGLAVALALQDTLSNLFAGLHIIASRQVKVGDFIKLESGEEGYVVDIRWRNTTVRALANNMIVVPNAKLASSVILNYYQPSVDLAVLVQVSVAYGSELEKVERVTVEVARECMRQVQGAVPEFEPFIRFHTFADSGINFSVIMRGREFTDQFLIKHEFIKRLHARYAQEGIEIPYPQRVVWVKQTGSA
jgi:small-conductance mechanosensitive channel